MRVAGQISRLILLLAPVLALSSCMPSDKELIHTQFDTELPGYSSIKVLKREMTRDDSTSRILTLRVTIDGYPNSVVCEGELTFAHGDPSRLSMKWDTPDGVEQSGLVQQARAALRTPSAPQLTEPAVLLIKRWIDMRLVNLDDIKYPAIRERVQGMMQGS